MGKYWVSMQTMANESVDRMDMAGNRTQQKVEHTAIAVVPVCEIRADYSILYITWDLEDAEKAANSLLRAMKKAFPNPKKELNSDDPKFFECRISVHSFPECPKCKRLWYKFPEETQLTPWVTLFERFCSHCGTELVQGKVIPDWQEEE